MFRLRYDPAVLLLIAMVSLVSLSGCPIFAYIAAVTRGPVEHPPKYDLAKHMDDGKLVVWVRAIPEELEARDANVRDVLGRRVTAKLKTEAKLEMISYDEVEKLLRRHPSVAQATPRQVGRKVGAEKVVYIDVRKFALRDTPRSVIYRGRLHLTVAIIDVKGGEQDWPTGVEGFSVRYEDDTREPERGDVTAEITRKIISEGSDLITRLFYTYIEPE